MAVGNGQEDADRDVKQSCISTVGIFAKARAPRMPQLQKAKLRNLKDTLH